jgi:phosphoserine phosphatase RsbU/P
VLRRHGFAAVAILALVALTILDITADVHIVPVVYYVIAPLAVATRGTPRQTAWVAAAAVPLATIVAIGSNMSTTARWVLAIAGVAAGGALAVWLANLRTRAEVQAHRLGELSQVEQVLTSALGALGEAVTVLDESGRMTYANSAAVELLRADSLDDLLNAAPGEIMSRFDVRSPEGEPLDVTQMPSRRLLAGDDYVPPLLVRNVVRATGEERFLLTKASLVPGRLGGPRRVVNVIEDLTELKRTEVQNAELAATLQRGMLPPVLPMIAGWSAAAMYHPAGEIGEVGGDFFDAFRAGEDWIVVIGDVAGHGPEAATLTALARYTLRTAAELTGDPVASIAQLNRSLREQGGLALCTTACVRLTRSGGEHTAYVASAGHPLPMLVRDGAVTRLGKAGPLTGAFDDEAWPVERVALRPGDLLVLYTDGVIDALSHRGRRGEAWIEPLLAARPATAERVIGRLDAALAAEPDERRRDDTAAVALQLLGIAGSVVDLEPHAGGAVGDAPPVGGRFDEEQAPAA